MHFAPVLTRTLAANSAAVRSMPLALQRRIYAHAGDVSGPGFYQVTGAPSGLNLRSSAAVDPANVLGQMPNGTVVQSDGSVDNGFAYVTLTSPIGGAATGWASVAYLAPASAGGGGSAPSADALPAGYYTANVTDALNLRSAPAVDPSNVIGAIPAGAQVQATGANENFFAQVNYQGTTGWASAHYLQPVSATGAVAMTQADQTQLRTLLIAWAEKNPTLGVPSYGQPDDMLPTAQAQSRQNQEVAAFQAWAGGLRTDGVVDDATMSALSTWAQAAAADALAANAPPAMQLPSLSDVVRAPIPNPNGTPNPNTPPDFTPVSTMTPGEQAGAAPKKSMMPLLLLAGGLAAVLMLEQKKKSKKRK